MLTFSVMHPALQSKGIHSLLVVDRPLLTYQMVDMNGEPLIFHGFDGSGKTCMALEFARLQISRRPKLSVLWTDASTPEACWTSMDEIAAKLLHGSEGQHRTWRLLTLK
jgi:hypothetical protein